MGNVVCAPRWGTVRLKDLVIVIAGKGEREHRKNARKAYKTVIKRYL